MQSLSACAPDALNKICGIFTDVDDTLTRDGKLEAATYAMLWRLKAAGIQVVPVTGRSFGWADMMLSQWPVSAVITESGGLCLYRQVQAEGAPSKTVRLFHQDEERVRRDRARLLALCEKLLHTHPGLRFARDNDLRLVDVAIDYCEEVPRVPQSTVDHFCEALRKQGFQARYSTVHINAWSGEFDKGPMARRYLEIAPLHTFMRSSDVWCAIGDAPNDQSLFEYFPFSVAVSNFSRFVGQSPIKPRYLTQASFGAGFCELASAILAHRGEPAA